MIPQTFLLILINIKYCRHGSTSLLCKDSISSVTDLHRLWHFIQQEVCMKFTGLQNLQQKLLFLQVFSNSDFAALTFHSSRIKWSYSFFFYIPMETLYNWRSLLNLQWSGTTLWPPLIFCLPPFCCTDPSKHRLNPTPECAVVSAPKC